MCAVVKAARAHFDRSLFARSIPHFDGCVTVVGALVSRVFCAIGSSTGGMRGRIEARNTESMIHDEVTPEGAPAFHSRTQPPPPHPPKTTKTNLLGKLNYCTQASMDEVDDLTEGKTLPVYCICRRGVDSRAAVELLAKRGFPSVTDVGGGLTEWARTVDGKFPMY